MKKFIIRMSVVFIFSLNLAGFAFAKEQANCPVMGGKINKEIFADHDGKRVYFCCAMCIDTFKKEPEKFLKKLEDAGVSVTKAAPEKKKEGSHEGHNHD